MTTPAPEPKPKRPRRMVVWMIAAPIVILLLALAGANWKTFHLAYAKHLIASSEHVKRARGADMVLRTHLREGMSLEEVRAILAPARVTETDIPTDLMPSSIRGFKVSVVDYPPECTPELGFDENDRLVRIVIPEEVEITDIPLPGK